MEQLPTEAQMDHPEQSGYLIYVFDVIKPGKTEKETVKAAAPDYIKAVRMLAQQWPHIELVKFRGVINPHVEVATA